MTRFSIALSLLSACSPAGSQNGADDSDEVDTLDSDTVGVDRDTEAFDTDTVPEETDTLGDTDTVEVDTVGVETDAIALETDSVDLVDTNIEPADTNDTVDYGGDVTTASYYGLCDQRQPGEAWVPETITLTFGEYFGESLLRYGITERSVLAAGGSPTWIDIPAEDSEHLPYDPRHSAAPLILPSVPGEYAIEMQVHRNGRDATWHRPRVEFQLCDPPDPGWQNLDLQTQTWVVIVDPWETGGSIDTSLRIETDTDPTLDSDSDSDTDLILDSDTGSGGP